MRWGVEHWFRHLSLHLDKVESTASLLPSTDDISTASTVNLFINKPSSGLGPPAYNEWKRLLILHGLHYNPVLCFSVSLQAEDNMIVSSSEAGEMCLWDLNDGKSVQVTKLPYVHTHIQPYQPANCEKVRLFCCGYYPEVIVMDPFCLEVVLTLSSRTSPDWISALHVLRPVKRKGKALLLLLLFLRGY